MIIRLRMKKNVTAGVPMLAISISHDPLRSFLRPVYFETEINAVYTGQRPVKNGDSARTRDSRTTIKPKTTKMFD